MPSFRVIAPLGGCLFEPRIFKDHMYLVTRNPAMLHANYKGADQPAHRQFYQRLCF